MEILSMFIVKKMDPRFFPVVLSNRTRGNRHKVNIKLTYEHEEKLPYFEGDLALQQAAREVVEFPSLDLFQTHLDAFLCNLL